VAIFVVSHAALTRSEAFWRGCYLYSTPKMDSFFRLEAKLRMMDDREAGRRVFLTGSSQTREDFDAEYLNRAFRGEGVVFHNLGISGGAQPIELAMIEDRLFEKHPDVIVHTTYVGSFYTRFSLLKLKYHFDPAILPWLRRTMGYPRMIGRRDAFIEAFLSMSSPLYRFRGSLQRIGRTYVKNRIGRGHRTGPILYAYEEAKPPSYYLDEIERVQGNKFRFNGQTEINEALFERFAADILARGIDFILIEGPTHPLIRRCYSAEVDRRYRAFLAGVSDRLGFDYLTEEDLPDFSEDDFIDFTHLNEGGRAKLSRFLETYLRGREAVVAAAADVHPE
jgi:hypothetical protein